MTASTTPARDLPDAREQPERLGHNVDRQTVLYCPYCAEETLFPLERGWECRSCFRAFSVAFLGLVSNDRAPKEQAQ